MASIESPSKALLCRSLTSPSCCCRLLGWHLLGLLWRLLRLLCGNAGTAAAVTGATA